jgi:hypothetical protein
MMTIFCSIMIVNAANQAFSESYVKFSLHALYSGFAIHKNFLDMNDCIKSSSVFYTRVKCFTSGPSVQRYVLNGSYKLVVLELPEMRGQQDNKS